MAVTGECQVCQVPVGHLGTCEIPGCPAFGMRPGSPEADDAARCWYARPSAAQARVMTADDAYDVLERRARLDYLEAARLIIEHEYGS